VATEDELIAASVGLADTPLREMAAAQMAAR
jgi:hypothetical protein